MGADKGLLPMCKAKGVFQFAAAGQHGNCRFGQSNRQRGVAAATPQDIWFFVDNSHHRVVGTAMNLAIVQQKKVGDFCQTEQRVLIRISNRLITGIAASHHPDIVCR